MVYCWEIFLSIGRRRIAKGASPQARSYEGVSKIWLAILKAAVNSSISRPSHKSYPFQHNVKFLAIYGLSIVNAVITTLRADSTLGWLAQNPIYVRTPMVRCYGRLFNGSVLWSSTSVILYIRTLQIPWPLRTGSPEIEKPLEKKKKNLAHTWPPYSTSAYELALK